MALRAIDVGEHRADKYFTLYACPGTAGVNALNQSWQSQGMQYSLLWIFPPFYLIGEAIQKLISARVDAILIVPKGVRNWTPLLAGLPIQASQSIGGKNAVTFGAQVPAYMRAEQFHLHLRAMLVLF